MNLASYIAIILLLIVLIKEIQYIRNLKIRTKKSTFEKITIVISVFALLALTYFFAKNYLHYFIALIALASFMVTWMKQGISDSGILLVARGKQLYAWDEIENAKINIGNTITVDYYMPSGSKLISHEYKLENYDKILKIFETKNLKFV